MKKDTGFKIVCMSLLTYALILTLVSFSSLQGDGMFASIYLRVPIVAYLFILISLIIGIYLIVKGDENIK